MWNLGWYLSRPLRNGLGIVGLALLLPGLVLAFRNREARAILGQPVIAFLIMLVAQRTIWNRWALPLLPILSIVAALGAVGLIDWVQLRSSKGWQVLTGTALAILSGIPLLMRDITQSRERLNDTRQQASRWVRAHVPPGKTVLLEHFGFDLVQRPNPFLLPLGALDPFEVCETEPDRYPTRSRGVRVATQVTVRN